jgi:hypothetical protein
MQTINSWDRVIVRMVVLVSFGLFDAYTALPGTPCAPALTTHPGPGCRRTQARLNVFAVLASLTRSLLSSMPPATCSCRPSSSPGRCDTRTGQRCFVESSRAAANKQQSERKYSLRMYTNYGRTCRQGIVHSVQCSEAMVGLLGIHLWYQKSLEKDSQDATDDCPEVTWLRQNAWLHSAPPGT